MHICSSFSSGNLTRAYLLHDDHHLYAFSALNLELVALLNITTKFEWPIALKHSSRTAAFFTSPPSGLDFASITRQTSETESVRDISCSYLCSHTFSGNFLSFRPGVSMRPTFLPSRFSRNVQRSVENCYVHPYS